jgi:hypothetical protein
MPTRRPIEFLSKGAKIRGDLVLPSGAGPFPLLVMGGGWCYVKEIVMPHYAEAIVDAGCAVLMFDYRCLGASEGEPRQHIDPWAQIEDYKNAISYAATLGHFLCRRPRADRRRDRPAGEMHRLEHPGGRRLREHAARARRGAL